MNAFLFYFNRCIGSGFPMKNTFETDDIDWTTLRMLEYSTNSSKSAVFEDDMELFYGNLKVEHVSVVLEEKAQDSHFVTLPPEAATVLEASTSVGRSMTSERRLTAASRFVFSLFQSYY